MPINIIFLLFFCFLLGAALGNLLSSLFVVRKKDDKIYELEREIILLKEGGEGYPPEGE